MKVELITMKSFLERLILAVKFDITVIKSCLRDFDKYLSFFDQLQNSERHSKALLNIFMCFSTISIYPSIS